MSITLLLSLYLYNSCYIICTMGAPCPPVSLLQAGCPGAPFEFFGALPQLFSTYTCMLCPLGSARCRCVHSFPPTWTVCCSSITLVLCSHGHCYWSAEVGSASRFLAGAPWCTSFASKNTVLHNMPVHTKFSCTKMLRTLGDYPRMCTEYMPMNTDFSN